MDKNLIRNFCIIAHIDHGKSTLADRILEKTGAVDPRHRQDQILDDMDLERERGITIKASTVRINYFLRDNNNYIFNLVDTPGHVDFTYEVSKSLSACEGAILVVDAAQGVEAQTVANFHLAKENKLKIIPVINKIDLSNADPERVKKQLVTVLGFKEEEILLISAKQAIGIDELLERIVKEIPPPRGDPQASLKALVFDSYYDPFKGVVVFVRIMDGALSIKEEIKFMQTQRVAVIEELGVFENLKYRTVTSLCPGDIGYFTANIRSPREISIGDTVTKLNNPASFPLAGFRKLKPLVFCGIYPVNPADFGSLRQAMEKLQLSDASFVYEPEESQSFGAGFRCGFLGLLHMEIVQERLEREYGLNLILTTPNVVYRVRKKNNEIIEIDNVRKFPNYNEIAEVQEPYVSLLLIIPQDSVESVCELVKYRRGIYQSSEYLGEARLCLNFTVPLSEIIVDFYDRIKSLTRGYGSIDYEFYNYFPTQISRIDVMLNGVVCDAFSFLVHKDKAYAKAKMLVERLKEVIPRQLFEVNIQVTADNRIIASEKIKPLAKHVTGKCYGGDITRKRKLWEIQKEGKKRLKQFGKVQIPQEAFLEVLKL
ncbi:MAG: translation elongation factor 4 [Candidatus Omnitrophica bacterium]|nr:translation elongation factor 4 [Candidatus Omnitrophota bacterium]